MLERCENDDTKYGGKDDATRWRPLYKQQDWGPMEHKIMQLEEKAKWTFKTFMAGDKRVKSIESQSGNTEFRLSRCNIAFENSEGLYSNHIAFK